jgi:predicted CoA-binding protein
MRSLRESATDFLDQKRIAVAGVSRKSGEAANLIFRKLRSAGYEVFAVNPKAQEVEGETSYPNLTAIERLRSSRNAQIWGFAMFGCTDRSAREAFPRRP